MIIAVLIAEGTCENKSLVNEIAKETQDVFDRYDATFGSIP